MKIEPWLSFNRVISPASRGGWPIVRGLHKGEKGSAVFVSLPDMRDLISSVTPFYRNLPPDTGGGLRCITCQVEPIRLMEFQYVPVRPPGGEKIQRLKRHTLAMVQE